MSEKPQNLNEYISKKDLEIILEVNRKSVELQTAIADQYEEIIDNLNKSKEICGDSDKIVENVIKTLSDKQEIIGKLITEKHDSLQKLVIDRHDILYKLINDPVIKKIGDSEDKICKKINDSEDKIIKKMADNLDLEKKQHEDLSRDLFQIKVLYISAIATIVLQIIQILKK